MKLIGLQQRLSHDEMELDLNGPSMLEVRDAIALLSSKYGAEVGLLMQLDEATKKDVQAFFLEKKVHVAFHATLHKDMFVTVCNGVFL